MGEGDRTGNADPETRRNGLVGEKGDTIRDEPDGAHKGPTIVEVGREGLGDKVQKLHKG
jgi:hypothetical protein